MKTYRLERDDGTAFAFEVSSAWVFMASLKRILKSVPEVEAVKRQWFSEVWIKFRYRGVACIVWEAFGDNSRLWIGPEDGKSCVLDFSSLEATFRRLPWWCSVV